MGMFVDHQWIPLRNGQQNGDLVFLLCRAEQSAEQTIEMPAT